MKKTLLICLTCLAISPAFAQRKEHKKRVTVAPGLRAGLNISNLNNSNGDSKKDFYLGLQLPIKFAKFYTLQPEFNYSRQGSKNFVPAYDFGFKGARNYDDLKLNYVGIDVINKFTFGKFNIQVGPGLAVLTESASIVDNDIDLTFNIGMGIDITKNFGIEARFKQGTIPVTELGYSRDFYRGTGDYQYNQTFQVGAYFKF
ncbi:MAG: PorT family protein [Flavobacteriaceae bacterium]|jgi:hypothetical protein|nr:PorT family protein [Flavobacteriaceae bacterium]